jgi:(E)-4-hydroxy-3-methylbut-2-enyl-diphosphate synthase
VDLAHLAEVIEARLRNEVAPRRRLRGLPPITVAVMGCEVNGPGEAAGADVGVACGAGRGVLFAKGKIIKTVNDDEIIDEILRLVEDYEAYSG